jgi:hypothetical protein
MHLISLVNIKQIYVVEIVELLIKKIIITF